MKVKKTNVYSSLIIDSIKEMIGLAKKGNFTAKQELNGVTVVVNGDSNADLIFRDQQRAQSGYIAGEVGPYPKAKLTAEDKANDSRVETENERKWQKRQASTTRRRVLIARRWRPSWPMPPRSSSPTKLAGRSSRT